MFLDLMICMQIFFISLILLILVVKYMLVMLMMIEVVMMNILLMMYLMMMYSELEFYFIYYLIFSVCESVMGLSLLVMNVRFYGNDFYYMVNMSKF